MTTEKDMVVRIEGSLGPLRGELIPPGDKSVSHRSLILGSIADGRTVVSGFLPSEDTLSTMNAMRSLGVEIHYEGLRVGREREVIIEGAGLFGLAEPPDVIDAGNSGTTARLLTGLLSAQTFFSVITGDRYLRERPMARVAAPLREMGAEIRGREGGAKLPLAIAGGVLHGIRYSPPQASAQVKSALILAALYAEGETVIEEPLPTRDHTERMLRHMGVEITSDGKVIKVKGLGKAGSLRGSRIDVPGDISSAAYFIVAALINPGSELLIKDVGINPRRSGVIEILREMGGNIDITNERSLSGEPVADIVVRSSVLRGVEIGGALIPRAIDELPVVAVAASFAEGKTAIRDAAELRVKETDRIAAVVSELGKLGAEVAETPDGMVIQGVKRLSGARCSSRGDHRMSMSIAVAATAAEGETEIDDAGSVAVSFPGFFEALGTLR